MARGVAQLAEGLRGRNGKVWEYYAIRQWTQLAIAEHFEMSVGQVNGIIQKARNEVPQQTREEIVQERIEQIRALNQKFTDQALHGVEFDDRNYRDLEAAKVLMQLHQREAKLLGLDKPVSVNADVNQVVTYVVMGLAADEMTALGPAAEVKELTQ